MKSSTIYNHNITITQFSRFKNLIPPLPQKKSRQFFIQTPGTDLILPKVFPKQSLIQISVQLAHAARCGAAEVFGWVFGHTGGAVAG